MEISLDLFSTLAKQGLLQQNPAQSMDQEKNKAVLDKNATAFFENGIVPSKFLITIAKKMVPDRE